MTRVSIIVPSFQQGHLIRQTLDSILTQGIGDLEVLVVEGGSSDSTVSVLQTYGDRIQWVSERDRGQTHAINKGFARARGEIVAYLNSDDTYEPGALGRALAVFEAEAGVDFVYGDANLIDETGRLIRATQAVDFDIGILTYDHNYICQPASFWRRRVLDMAGPFDESLYFLMDYEYFLRLAHLGFRFKHLRVPLANLRLHASCKTVAGYADSDDKLGRVREEVLSRYRRHFGAGALDPLVWRTLKVAYRGKKLLKDIVENGHLPRFEQRELMARMRAVK